MSDEDKRVDEMWGDVQEVTPSWSAPLIFVKSLWYPVMKAFLRIYDQPRRKRADNLCVYGNTDTGKSTCFDKIIPSFMRKRGLHSNEIVQITSKVNMTTGGLYRAGLNHLNYDYKERDNVATLEERLVNALIEKNVGIFVVDEFHMVYDNVSSRKDVLKGLRNIPTHTMVPLVVIGTPKIKTLMELDSETNNRYEKLEFPRFELVGDKYKELQKVVGTLDADLYSSKGIKSNFATNETALVKLYKASKGKMGSLVKIYERTVNNIALEQDLKKLEPKHVDDAVNQLDKSQKLDDDYPIEVVIPNRWKKFDI
ncbi:MAG: TniB family NTP-binding protein [Candidatus Hodarchaeales archaeon]|jgi:hypothetical protein